MSELPVISVSDQEIVNALARGEPTAIAALYQRHGARMVRFAHRYVTDRSAAEDVVIGLLGRWLERPPRIRDAERLSTFLATSVYNATIDWMRRERAQRGENPRLEPSATGAAPAVVPREKLRERLRVASSRLAPDDRLLLESHYGRALTTEECMEMLGISRAAFHQRLHRARERLAGFMGPEGEA